MTKIVTVLALFFLPLFSFSQNRSLSALQKKYKDDNVFTFSFSGNILKFLDGVEFAGNDPEFKLLAKKIQSLHMLGVSSRSKGYSSRDIRKLKKEIRKQAFEEVISVKSGKGQLQLLVRDRHGKPTEVIMIIHKDSEGFITMDFSEKDAE